MVRYLLLLALIAAPCDADLLVHDPFDYPEAALTGLAGGSGWSGGWTQDGESCVVTAGSLSYLDAASNELIASGRIADTAGVDTTRNFRIVSGGPLDDVWISFLWRLPASNSLYEGINFYLGATSLFAVSNASTTSGPQLTLNNFAAGGAAATGKGAFGQTHFVVLHLAAGAGPAGNDQVELFIDPPLTGPPGAADGVIFAADLGFDRIRMAGQSGASLEVDELRIGEAFADVAPHQPAPNDDPDGDGLSNDQELALGLDPNVSDAELVLAIREHPAFFDLHDEAGILGLVDHGIVVEGTDGVVDLTFEIQQTTDLFSWSLFETIRRSIVLLPGKNFVRLSLDAPPP